MKIIFALIFLILPFSANALAPENRLADAIYEQRAMNLFLEVRCIVCQGQVVENSNTEFAYEMRKFIRDRISEGKSDDEIRDELVEKFGADILTSAAPSKGNIVLWILPALFAAFLVIYYRKKLSV